MDSGVKSIFSKYGLAPYFDSLLASRPSTGGVLEAENLCAQSRSFGVLVAY